MFLKSTILTTILVGGQLGGALVAQSSSPHAPPTLTTSFDTPAYRYSSFSYTQLSSNRYATPLSSPISFSTPYAPPFSEASTLLPSGVTYTTYSFNPTATAASASRTGEYDQQAYNNLWTSLSYTASPPFTTTVSPTPVPSDDLLFPPALTPYLANPDKKLPPDFIWGVAGSAWQIEGSLQLEGRGPSILDTIGSIQANSSASDANVATMNYYLYKQDIARLAALGVPYYSFSIAWSRIVPFGVAGSPVNSEGLAHYDDLINTCLEYGVTPIVTLVHADYPPSVVADMGNLTTHYLYFAKQVMTRFADRVPYWVTFNEPNISVGSVAKSYSILKDILLAHAAVYRWYKETLGGTAQITLKFANNLALPLDPTNSTHLASAVRYQNFILGIMGNPLLLGEQIPSEVLTTPNITLSALTDAELAAVNGTVDFISIDPYTAQFASPAPEGIEACSANASNALWPSCATLTNVQANGWLMGEASNDYAYIAPQYVRQQLGYLWNTFRPKGILVAEFGFNPFADANRSLNAQRYDLERTLYYHFFLREVLTAIHEDGINVVGALAWSVLDNDEFGSYANMYGLQTVNRTDGRFERHYKRSFFDYVDFFHHHIES
ncbi:glycoside hydrolase [Aspergillus saccharolyticus JOP 1030-1]|uniref:Glycoside hydrolase n=1 Tax=Aspergillus saccharolyticus JOP 1030-1 TaxID=1450539 RepID=A0A318ZG96_9EURO|nr:glycoside hydrolase [Aspergillus saccharolyticus JOP 1030-1]PYH46479.1 glycoside hydrolase [Aspergillus saccharolyticus JOP 1030-1]